MLQLYSKGKSFQFNVKYRTDHPKTGLSDSSTKNKELSQVKWNPSAYSNKISLEAVWIDL